MKRLRVLMLLVAVAFVLGTNPAEAILINNGNGTVTDGHGLMWLQAPAATDMTWANAVAWADNLVFAGYDDWRLPTALDFTTGAPDTAWRSTNNEFGYLYGVELGNPAGTSEIAPLTGYTPLWFWTGTANGASNAYAFFWSYDDVWLNQSAARTNLFHLTAVRDGGDDDDGDGDGTGVPEPATLFLFGSGLACLAATARRRRP
jgi:hypothetical protein